MTEEEPERSNRVEAFGRPLSTHLQRLNELRARMTPEERNNPLPTLHVVSKPPPEPPATAAEIIKHLAYLDVIFPSQALTTEERSLRYRIFCADLGHLPEWKIRNACERYRKSSENRFYPTPGQLLALCK